MSLVTTAPSSAPDVATAQVSRSKQPLAPSISKSMQDAAKSKKPKIAFAVGLLLIPLKLMQLATESGWTSLQEIDVAGIVSIAVIVLEGFVAGAVFMFAVSYSLTFFQSIGKVGDDVTNHIARVGDDIVEVKHFVTEAPAPVVEAPIVNLPENCIRVEPDVKRWLESMLRDAKEQASFDDAELKQNLEELRGDLIAVQSALEAEKVERKRAESDLESVNRQFSDLYGTNIKQTELISHIIPIVAALKRLELPVATLSEPSISAPEDDPAPTHQ